MSRVWIDHDEWYPVYSVETTNPYMPDQKWHEIDDEKLAEIARVFAEFDEIQSFLRKLEDDL